MSNQKMLHQRIELKRVKELLEERWLLPWLSWAIFHWVVIAACMYYAIRWNHPIGYIIAVAIIGNRQHSLLLLGHDGAHYLACNSRKLNDFLTVALAFWPLCISMNAYRKFHFAHHRHLGTEKDPELHFKKSIAPEFDLPQDRKKVIIQTIKNLLGLNALGMFRTTALVFPGNYKMAWMLTSTAIVMVIFAAVGLWKVFALWVVAFCTTYLAANKWRTWTEHMGTAGTRRTDLTRLQRFLYSPMNNYCHHEHHLWASVPFWKLPLVRKLVTDENCVTEKELWEIYKNSPPIPAGEPANETLKNGYFEFYEEEVASV